MRITFGRYLPGKSIIHRMDSRLKLLMIIMLIIAVFLPIGYTGYLFLTTFIFILFFLSRLQLRLLWRILPPVFFIFIVILFINFFLMHPDKNVLNELLSLIGGGGNHLQISNIDLTKHANGWKGYIGPKYAYDATGAAGDLGRHVATIGSFYNWKALWFSEKAIYAALLMGWRIYLMLMVTTILTATTQPLDLTLAIEDLLFPLAFIGIPVYIISMIISIALRMIPTLIDEADRIMKAQASRGVDIKSGNFKTKIVGLTSLIIPLLVSSFQKAEDLAYAMDARGYDPHGKRTRFVQFQFHLVDWIIFAFSVALFVWCIVYMKIAPLYYPWLHLPHIDQIISY